MTPTSAALTGPTPPVSADVVFVVAWSQLGGKINFSAPAVMTACAALISFPVYVLTKAVLVAGASAPLPCAVSWVMQLALVVPEYVQDAKTCCVAALVVVTLV